MWFKQAIALSIFLAAPFSIQAQDDLGTINVTASRAAAPSITSSRPVTVIDRQMIEDSHADSLVTLLKGQSNITIRDTSGNGAKAIVDLGGFGDSAASNKIVLIDGRRISNPDLSEADWTQIPLSQIERVEIVHGGGSVLYGDGGVGGVINIITRVPESGGSIGFSGGSYGQYAGYTRIGAESGRIRMEASFSGDKNDGYRRNGNLERYDGGARFEVDILDNVTWYASGNHHRDRFGLPGTLTAAEIASFGRTHSTTPRDHGRTSDGFVDSGLLVGWQKFELDFPVSFRRREVVSNFVSSSFSSTSTLRTLSTRPKLNWQHDTGEWMTSLTAGADIDRVDGVVSSLNSERNRTGYYGQFTVGDSGQRFVFSGGLRSEKVKDVLNQTGGNSVSNTLTAYDAGLSAGLGDFRLRMNHNRSIRMPRLDERSPIWPATAFRTDLVPQTGKHYLVSLRYTASTAWLELTASRADLKKEIYFDPTVGAFGQNSNYPDPTRHDVFIVGGYWEAHEWANLSANYTYTKASFRGGSFNGRIIPAVPKSRAGANWRAQWMKAFSTTLFATFVGDSFVINDQPNAQQKLDSYLTLDAVASYQWYGLEVFARVNNLTNRKYSTAAAINTAGTRLGYYPAPEINFRGGVNYSF